MRRMVWLACAGSAWFAACGSDETLSPLDAGVSAGVDVCGALDTLLSVPGVTERLCALNQDGTPAATQQCTLCATTTTTLTALLPDVACPAALENCPVEDAALRSCFATVGQLMTEALPGCTPGDTPALDPTAIALRIATSSCTPVLSDCPPLSQLVFDLLGTAF